ncbi:NADPH:quinone reductase [Streptomyces sp. NBC_01613]|uniref:NADPH:quinone reductase n=1 Tax=Streptomyces sp. NBC_01613 TaxID=2975896 RepID=UPI003867A1AB
MKAVWFERKGPAADVLTYGEMDDPRPAPGEVRLRLAFSGINPGDVKKRLGTYQSAMAFPRIIPHTDGSGTVDQVGDGVSPDWIGKQVWCSYAQTYRPFGTAAEYTTVPVHCVAEAPQALDPAQAACLGIPGITGHRAVFADGPVTGRTVLVVAGTGGVGRAAVVLAKRGGARVIATVSKEHQLTEALSAGADHALLAGDHLAAQVKEIVPQGVDRIIEVAFSDNIHQDVEMLAIGGTVVSYSSRDDRPHIPFRSMVFNNLTARMIGYDDFPADAVSAAMKDVTAAAAAGDLTYPIGKTFPLEQTAQAEQALENRSAPGRVVVAVQHGH